MKVKCTHCGQVCETEAELSLGQELTCPVCGKEFCCEALFGVQEHGNEVSNIRTMCPHCSAEYEVGGGCCGEVVCCTNCGREFIIQEAMRKRVFKMSKPLVTAGEKSVEERNDKAQRNRSKAQGCLPAALFFLTWFFVAVFHNWASVAVSVACAFTAIMICVYNKLYAQMDGQTTIGDIFKRLGFGGSSIFLIAFTLGCTLLMHSCDRQAKEEELESQRNARIVRERKEEEMRNTNQYSITCPMCNFKGPIFIKIGTNLADVRKRCPNCGYFMDYRHLLPAGY